MRFYSTIRKVLLSGDVISKAREFARRVVPTTDYGDSKQTSTEKVRNDHFISKLGEEAAKMVLDKYAVVIGPDYNIYDASQKSWADDLFINKVGLAVKTQKRSTALRFGLSWTFQSGDYRRDTILSRPDAWVVFVEYDDNVGNACNVYPPFQMKELILGDPVLQRLIGHKKVVYASTLKM